jgi:hypothetical protein
MCGLEGTRKDANAMNNTRSSANTRNGVASRPTLLGKCYERRAGAPNPVIREIKMVISAFIAARAPYE